jgi:hypothetical protein
MAFGTSSAVFQEWVKGVLAKSATSFGGLTTDTVNVALYGNSGTPDKNAAVGLTGYNAATSAWVSSNQVTDTNWPAVGRPLVSSTLTASSGTVKFDAADTASNGSVTLANVYGCLVYDDTISGGTVADQGVCFNYFGGAQSVTSGTFTVVWNASGIFTMTV